MFGTGDSLLNIAVGMDNALWFASRAGSIEHVAVVVFAHVGNFKFTTGSRHGLAVVDDIIGFRQSFRPTFDDYDFLEIGQIFLNIFDARIEIGVGYFWFFGRVDDVIMTAGERVGPFEVESALVTYPDVIEAGVIGKPDEVRGEIIKAFVVVKPGVAQDDELKEKLKQHVKKHLAGHAYPREIAFIDKLPKTRSGKIMRRILKAQEMGLPVGDTSTLENY